MNELNNPNNPNKPNKPNKPKNKLVLCELHNRKLHGYSKEYSDPTIDGHYLVIEHFPSLDDEYHVGETESQSDSDSESELENGIYSATELYKTKYITLYTKYGSKLKHPFIRNYSNIISKDSYIKPEIAKCLYLKGDEFVAILKTYWLRLVQRNWKRVYSERKKILKNRMNPASLFHRQVNGKWPNHCSYYPLLRGMLSNL